MKTKRLRQISSPILEGSRNQGGCSGKKGVQSEAISISFAVCVYFSRFPKKNQIPQERIKSLQFHVPLYAPFTLKHFESSFS